MNTFQTIILSVIIALSAARPPLEDPSLNDPKLGQLVQAYMQISKLLPKLSPEEHRVIVNHQHYQSQKVHEHPQHIHYVPETPQPYIPPVTSAPLVQDPLNQPRWTGPLADHVLGQQVQETPEVAAARNLHQVAYAEIRAVLPVLPAEEDDEPSVNQQLRHVQGNSVVPTGSFIHTLGSTYSTTARPVSYVQTQWGDFQEDTPEVAAARREHAQAYAAALGR